MHAEIIAIGDELTSGQRLDTNSQWLAVALGELGIGVLYHTTVGDDMAANVEVFRTAIKRADLVVATGGLGPTADDLTRPAIAEAVGVELYEDAASLAHIRKLFTSRGRTMPQQNVVQAMFPVGSRPIPNPHGTAPGIQLEVARSGGAPSLLFALPGVPAEMKEMWHATLAGEIARHFPNRQIIRQRRIKCFGVGESKLEAMLPDLIRRGREPSVGITVHQATITLRVMASGPTEQACYEAMEPTLQTIRESLGTLAFGEEDDELEHVVARLLAEKNRTLATCEWGTGGLLAHWLHEALDERAYLGGSVIRSPQAAILGAGVAGETIDQHGPVSESIARELGASIRTRLGAHYGLVVGAFPEVDPDADEPPSFFLALATPEIIHIKSSPFAGHPEILKARAAKQALNLLRLTLIGR
ncbi:MAG: CinA family nicotinamide mononucleotide deamidase-related protein [Planctomycetes bacterium]|nr:CinA family nicotinamide mononucleotide deamidase-related protein [Planctomycetota bacterium]